ncbi:pilus assembly protein TadC [Rhodobacter sp. TJ_12]|uniref:type II secretion system F family protein n=1 Tax=Rhodobacter sp. TJ_12 TaxID=2029399 RepID=UPI001CBE0B05|nr:type II secretion system F family protein [Rhodobacter sp. TJ_12]MBZ4021248.1 pilus assembly protein TadC [Rhodobacter sp. TJ_12]
MSIDSITNLLTGMFGPMGPVIALAALGGLLILAALPMMLKKREDPLDKLRASVAASAASAGAQAPRKVQPLRNSGGNDKLEKFAGFLEPKNKEEMSESRKWLQKGGYRGANAVRTYHAIQFALALGLLGLGVGYVLLYNATKPVPLESTVAIMAILGPGVLGYYAPTYWVNKRIAARTDEIANGFPDALDMLLVCVEAGLSLDQGIIRVSKELVSSYPALAEEFETVAHEIKAGLDKPSVLRAFADRSGVPDVASFVTVMIQSQQFGTSIAEALRLYAADMRDKRIMRAEEAANKIPTKMTLGTMMFTVPPLLIILVGPSVHDMMENFNSISQM